MNLQVVKIVKNEKLFLMNKLKIVSYKQKEEFWK
mgnify:CR=1 FL=1